jgi:hypothetical protein
MRNINKGEINLPPYIKIEVESSFENLCRKNKYTAAKQIIITVPFESINQVSLTGSRRM